MVTTKERKERHAMRVLRIEIYGLIDKLDAERCDNCRGDIGSNAPISKMRCGCAASTKIRKLASYL